MVKLADILSPPVCVGITTSQNIEKFAHIAKENPHLLPVISLAKTIDGKLYALNHHDVIQGCKKAGPNTISEIHATINKEDCNGSSDVLISHVREITNNEVFNPVFIFDAVDFLEERLENKDRKAILELLSLDDTIYEKLILSGNNNHISEQSVQMLQSITSGLSQRKIVPYLVSVPPYVLSKISRLDSDVQQVMIIQEMQVDIKHMTDAKFAWHTPEQIDHMIKSNRQNATHEEYNREESQVATYTKTSEVGKPKTTTAKKKQSKLQGENSPSSSNQGNATKTHPNENVNTNQQQEEELDPEVQTIKKTIPNMIVITDQKSGKPQMLVNKKTGVVAHIEPSENKDIIKTTSAGTKSLYSMPLDVTKHLEFDSSNEDVDGNNGDTHKVTKHKNFESIGDLKEFLKKLSSTTQKQQQIHFTLFWTNIT